MCWERYLEQEDLQAKPASQKTQAEPAPEAKPEALLEEAPQPA